MNDKESIFGLLDNKYIRGFMHYSSLISFGISNFTIFYLIKLFFVFNTWPGVDPMGFTILFFLVGLGIAFALVKTEYLIKVAKHKESRVEEKKDKDEIYELNKDVSLGWRNSIIIFTRLLFFNFLKDLFIVLIIWTGIFGLSHFIGLGIVREDQFGALVDLLSIVGILSAVFQFYIQDYKQNITKQVTGGLSKHLIRILNKTSFKEFMIYLKDKDNPFFNKIESKMKANPLEPLMRMFRDQRSGRDSTNITLNLFAQNDAMLANLLEFTDIDKTALKGKYDEFFKAKDAEIEKELDKIDIGDLQKTLLPGILFFDEAQIEMIKMLYITKDASEPETFEEYRLIHAEKNISYLMYKILDTKHAK